MIVLHTLGVLDLRDSEGAEIRSVLQQPKRLALLLFLATASPRRYHRRDSLLAMFWPELDEEHARAALRRSLYVLRSALGADAIEARGEEEVRVAPEQVWCDTIAFEEALQAQDKERALELYRGDLLEGFHVTGAPQVEDWLDRERGRLRDGAARAAWALADASERAHSEPDAARWGRRAFELTPNDEDALRRVLRLLDRVGDRSAALGAYEGFVRRRALEEEAPSAETQLLVEAIRARPERPRPVGAIDGPHTSGGLDSSGALASPAAEDVALRPLFPDAPSTGRGTQAEVLLPNARLRRWLYPGVAAVLVGLAATASIAVSHRKSDLDPKRIVVTNFQNRTGNASLDPLGLIATDWITRGLSETHLVEVVDPSVVVALGPAPASRWKFADLMGQARQLTVDTKAGTMVVGSYYGQGDSLYFEAKVVDAARNRILTALPPIGAPSSRPLTAIDALRRRVMVALAFRFDPRLRDFPSTSQPPTYEAYRRYVEGLAVHMRGDFRGAIREFMLAAASDSQFRAPLIVAAADYFYLDEYAVADSLVRLVSRSRERLTPFEENTLEWLQARLGGDRMKALQISREAGNLAPGTVTQLQVAFDALSVSRPHEALAVLDGIDPDRGLLRESGNFYWVARTIAHHALGDHVLELRAAEQARKRDGGSWDALFLEMRALAALGRLSALSARLDESVGMVQNGLYSPGLALILIGQDLHAHGHSAAAREVFERAVAWQRARPPEEAGTRWAQARLSHYLYLAGDWDAAQRLAAEIAAQDTSDWDSRALLARLAARRGDRAEAELVSQKLVTIHEPYLFGFTTRARADVAALLGKREEAVALLRQALAEGFPWVYELHIDPDLESLRGYPPYEELLRPQD
jgi:DNA-binding SARP family transcriptional activator/tetratricopeptide (TPR) repeat protein